MTQAEVTPAEVHGTCSGRFAAVRDELARQLASGAELGASIVVDVGGETVVDIWGGHCDEARTRPWTRDTITLGSAGHRGGHVRHRHGHGTARRAGAMVGAGHGLWLPRA